MTVALFFYPLERLKELTKIFFLDSDTRVDYIKAELDVIFIDSDVTYHKRYAAGLSIFNGICKKVHYYLADPYVITVKL